MKFHVFQKNKVKNFVQYKAQSCIQTNTQAKVRANAAYAKKKSRNVQPALCPLHFKSKISRF